MRKNSEYERKQAGKYRVVTILIWVLSILLGILFVGGGAALIGTYKLLNSMQETPTTLNYEEQNQLIEEIAQENRHSEEELKDLEEVEIVTMHTGVKKVETTTAADEKEPEQTIFNFLLMGLDNGAKEAVQGRSDVNIIVTLDTAQRSIKLTSVMRDTLVPIEGHDYNRINTVNVFLGPDAMVETVERYTGIPLEGYVKMNFSTVAKVIDILGGVDVYLNNQEIMHTNENAPGHEITGGSNPYHLDGVQAVSYMRIRHMGNGEFDRTGRQRKVLTQVMHDMRSISMVGATKLITQIAPYLKTDLSEDELLKYAMMVYNLRTAEVTDLNIPVDGLYKAKRYKGMYILDIDFDANAAIIQNFIYGDGSMVPKKEEE